MTDDRYDRVTFRGVTVDKYTRAALLAVEKELGYELTLWQGSYHKGVSKSAGTHDGGGVVDLNGYFDAANKVKALRRNGFVADLRNQPSLSMEIHAVQIGNAKVSASARAQIAPMIRGRAGLARDVPQVIKYSPPGGYKAFDYEAATRIKPPARPATKPRSWFGIDLRNLAGFNDYGAATFDKRLGLTIEDIRTVGRDVVCVLELPNGKVDDCNERMKKIGYNHVAGDLGRHIYVEAKILTSGAKMFDLTPRLHGDTKQGAAVEVRPGKTPALIVTAQLENEDATGDTQVAQAKNLVKQSLEYAAHRGIPKDRVFFAVDSNSDNRVRSEVFEPAGYFDVFDTAYSSENSAWRSFVGWVLKPTKGKRIDLLAAYKTRPVRRARLRLTTRHLSDHLDTFADIGAK